MFTCSSQTAKGFVILVLIVSQLVTDITESKQGKSPGLPLESSGLLYNHVYLMNPVFLSAKYLNACMRSSPYKLCMLITSKLSISSFISSLPFPRSIRTDLDIGFGISALL